MPKQVIMPQLGEAVTEATLTKWLKAKGEPVKEFEALLEVNTDKVDTEVPSPASGVLLDILIPEGANVQVGTVLAWIGEPGEPLQPGTAKIGSHTDVLAAAPAAEKVLVEAASYSVSVKVPEPGDDRQLGFISPLVKRMAREHNLDLHQIPGTGQGGRITKQDVQVYLENQAARQPGNQAIGQPGNLAIRQQAVVSTQTASYPPFSLPGDEIVPLNPVRRAIAEHMVFSERTSPHVTTVMEADLSRVVAHRQANKEKFSRDGSNLTFTAYFVAAAAGALKTHPLVNSSWSDGGIIIHHTINIGMAASLGEAGLIVPVIRSAESLSLLGLARAINDLAERARRRQLKPDEVKGGTFTITNHGVTGSLFAAPIINQPQCAILGVGAIQKRPVVISDALGNDALAIRPMVYLSLTFDHRILDGAMADLFLSEVVKSLENYT